MEKTRPIERAEAHEEPKLKERAKGVERTIDKERADLIDKFMVEERAGEDKKTKCSIASRTTRGNHNQLASHRNGENQTY